MLVKILKNNINNDEINKLINNYTLFVGIFSDSCHYCIEMKPEWIKFKKMALSNSSLQGAILEIDSSIVSSLTNPLIANNVNGFPSLFIIKNNKIIKYNNERTALEFMKCFKSHIAKSKAKSKSKSKAKSKSKSKKSTKQKSKSKSKKSTKQKSKL
uniref:Thioredoxin domain-containing protein n=1 Tax=viral metagenome TaxID=1070528 RepID=A0A6C0DV76_9ZZZZ